MLKDQDSPKFTGAQDKGGLDSVEYGTINWPVNTNINTIYLSKWNEF